ncbi:MFS general substrate transporter [Corynespora cassiicola Philippines]|uniref:MFS general substrate transporter n=1 Tax=Corynespora cassiicola Philippines TaxID=1448308 RepID=A0A2T2NAR5_CORCC|nr:MFS general substrate transporter [Corynespora cassiicola Philippines]
MSDTTDFKDSHKSRPGISQWDLASDTIAHTVPPKDSGRDAWLVLTSGLILGAMVWGFPYSFGVFQEYYLRQKEFSSSHSGVAAIGTTSMGVMYLKAPLLYVVFHRYHAHRKMIGLGGFIIMLVSLVGASFASTVSQLLATQGVLYAIGGAMLYFPIFNYIDEWFIKRRAFAYGALVASDGAGGVIIPFAMEWILNRWGFRTALRTWTIVCFFLGTPALVFLKPYPVDPNTEQVSRKIDLRFLKTKTFWILQSGNIIQSLGYFIPSYYLPSFAVACGWSPFIGTIAVSLCNAALVFGALMIGWICDHHHVTVALVICTIGTVISVVIFWGFSVYQPVMYTFAILYGFFAGGFTATWSGCSHPIRRVYPVETGMIVALFTAGKGVGSLASGPLGGLLVISDTWKGHAGYAYGSGFGYLIVFSSVTASLGCLGWVGKKIGWVL